MQEASACPHPSTPVHQEAALLLLPKFVSTAPTCPPDTDDIVVAPLPPANSVMTIDSGGGTSAAEEQGEPPNASKTQGTPPGAQEARPTEEAATPVEITGRDKEGVRSLGMAPGG